MYIKNLLHIPRLFYTDLLFYPNNDLSWLSNSLFFHFQWTPLISEELIRM